ncbi:hypothetical protein TUM3794_03420 [Shewanella colwelliana]|uniref:Uncharacterized protein n=1 Tax=Shewanella colwelliana TaxID=23 RepID=A0ABQ4NUM6_SHECO|nr:hypothetical protein TUM3794_03420 [Shewanella colwelliana]
MIGLIQLIRSDVNSSMFFGVLYFCDLYEGKPAQRNNRKNRVEVNVNELKLISSTSAGITFRCFLPYCSM